MTFANLALSTARHFTPDLMWESLRDETGLPVNVMVRPALSFCCYGTSIRCRSAGNVWQTTPKQCAVI